jgi:hypothetical protein
MNKGPGAKKIFIIVERTARTIQNRMGRTN